MTARAIAEKRGAKRVTVEKWLRMQNVPWRPRPRRIPFDQAAFDNAETNPIAAYFVGLMMADGWITKRPGMQAYIGLSLSGIDGEHLQDFRTFLGSGHKITHVAAKPSVLVAGRESMAQDAYRFCISSDRLAGALAQYGVDENKTKTGELRKVDDSPDAWRGVMCGDGWVSRDAKGIPICGIVGNRRIVEQFLLFVGRRMTTKAKSHRMHSIWAARFDRHAAVRVLRMLFWPGCMALARKRDAALAILRD